MLSVYLIMSDVEKHNAKYKRDNRILLYLAVGMWAWVIVEMFNW